MTARLAILGTASAFVLLAALPARAADRPLEELVAELPAVQVTVPADVDNPGSLCFTVSADHATIDGYDADLLRPDSSVLQTLNLGKPAPDAAGVACAPVNVQPVNFGVGYAFRARARAGTAFSVYALSLNKFNRVPGGPTKVFAK